MENIQGVSGEAPEGPPQFRPGQLVRHRRYGYRGVVVDSDLTFRGDEGWYQSNKTQPAQNQPWYHVLVHGSPSTTYAAQTSLMADTSRDPIVHSLLEYFFTEFKNGAYVRNERPWPSD
jgi:heat shock protein HspQ